MDEYKTGKYNELKKSKAYNDHLTKEMLEFLKEVTEKEEGDSK
jgi:hypothetical protein